MHLIYFDTAHPSPPESENNTRTDLIRDSADDSVVGRPVRTPWRQTPRSGCGGFSFPAEVGNERLSGRAPEGRGHSAFHILNGRRGESAGCRKKSRDAGADEIQRRRGEAYPNWRRTFNRTHCENSHWSVVWTSRAHIFLQIFSFDIFCL